MRTGLAAEWWDIVLLVMVLEARFGSGVVSQIDCPPSAGRQAQLRFANNGYQRGNQLANSASSLTRHRVMQITFFQDFSAKRRFGTYRSKFSAYPPIEGVLRTREAIN